MKTEFRQELRKKKLNETLSKSRSGSDSYEEKKDFAGAE